MKKLATASTNTWRANSAADALQIQHAGEEFSGAGWPAEFHPNRTHVRFYCHVKVKEPAALPLRVDHIRNHRQKTWFRVESNAVPTWKIDSLLGSTHESAEKILASGPECGRT